jgi:precorrin-6B methylase 1
MFWIKVVQKTTHTFHVQYTFTINLVAIKLPKISNFQTVISKLKVSICSKRVKSKIVTECLHFLIPFPLSRTAATIFTGEFNRPLVIAVYLELSNF